MDQGGREDVVDKAGADTLPGKSEGAEVVEVVKEDANAEEDGINGTAVGWSAMPRSSKDAKGSCEGNVEDEVFPLKGKIEHTCILHQQTCTHTCTQAKHTHTLQYQAVTDYHWLATCVNLGCLQNQLL